MTVAGTRMAFSQAMLQNADIFSRRLGFIDNGSCLRGLGRLASDAVLGAGIQILVVRCGAHPGVHVPMFQRLLGLAHMGTAPQVAFLVQFVRLIGISYLVVLLLRVVLLPQVGVFATAPKALIPVLLTIAPVLLPWQRWISAVRGAQWFLWLTTGAISTILLALSWATGVIGWWAIPLVAPVFAPALVSLGLSTKPSESLWALNRTQVVVLVGWGVMWVLLWWVTLKGPGQHPHEAMLMARETFVALAVTLVWYVLLQASVCNHSLAKTRFAFVVGYLILSVLFILPNNAFHALLQSHSVLVAKTPVTVWLWPVLVAVSGLLWKFRFSPKVVPVSVTIGLAWSAMYVKANPSLAFHILPAMAVLWLWLAKPQRWFIPVLGWIGTMSLFGWAPGIDHTQFVLHSLSGTAVFVLTLLLLHRISDETVVEDTQTAPSFADLALSPIENGWTATIGFCIGVMTPLIGITAVPAPTVAYMQAMVLLGILLGLGAYSSARYLLEQQARWRVLQELAALRESDVLRQRLELAMRATGLGWFEMDRQRGTVTWDGKAASAWGFPEFVQGHTQLLQTMMQGVHPEDLAMLKNFWDAPAVEESNHHLEFRVLWRDGSEHWLEAQFMHETNDQGQMVRLMGFVHDVTERKNLEQRLEAQSKNDALTGLPNRRHLYSIAANEFDRGRRHGSACAVALLDVDHFKQVNDNFGHATGDLLLRHLATVCRAELRRIDTIGRLGGEEFVILMPHTDEATAAMALDRLRGVLQSSTVTLDSGKELGFTVSIGLTTQKADETDFDTILKRADAAMYEAKHMGRNQVRPG